MGLLKNIFRTVTMSRDETIRQYVAFELSIEYKLENKIPLDAHEEKFVYTRMELREKLGLSFEEHERIRTELESSWQHVLKRD